MLFNRRGVLALVLGAGAYAVLPQPAKAFDVPEWDETILIQDKATLDSLKTAVFGNASVSNVRANIAIAHGIMVGVGVAADLPNGTSVFYDAGYENENHRAALLGAGVVELHDAAHNGLYIKGVEQPQAVAGRWTSYVLGQPNGQEGVDKITLNPDRAEAVAIGQRAFKDSGKPGFPRYQQTLGLN